LKLEIAVQCTKITPSSSVYQITPSSSVYQNYTVLQILSMQMLRQLMT